MPLNIKDPDTHALAKRLASLTGESLAKAVKLAIQERLAQVEKPRVRPGLRMNWITLPCIAPVCRAATGGAPSRSLVMTNVVFRSDGRRRRFL